MAAYLLTWNPKKWHWKNLSSWAAKLREGKPIIDPWCCASKDIKPGDRIILLRLGEPPKGILASGRAESSWYFERHWGPTRRAQGKKARYVKIQYDALLNPDKEPLLPRNLLDAGALRTMHWDSQSSGVKIPDSVAEELEKLWTQFLNKNTKNKPYILAPESEFLPEEVLDTEEFQEGATKRISVNIYERNPYARRKCIEHYGLSCSVCGFDFEKVYGTLGKNFIHVHHLISLAEIGREYKIDPVRDLPICPNCHAMIHRKKTAYSIEELR